MQRTTTRYHFCALTILFCVNGLCQTPTNALGQFEAQSDIGTLLHPGSAAFDGANGSYSITSSGENMWAVEDDFHFVWKKLSGDVSLTADITFPTKTGNPHKKAALMIRQSLDADSPYVDAALHVVGLTSLQSREEKGGATHEVGTDAASPTRLRLVKRGDNFYLYFARPGEDLHLAGGSMRLVLKEPFYVGLAVCAHDKDAQETAVFSNVSIETPTKGKPKLYSTLETISVSSTDRRVVAVFDGRIAAASWTPDGTALLFEKGKQMEQIPAVGGKIENAAAPKKQQKAGASEIPSPDGQRVASLSYDGRAPRDTTLSMKTLSDGKIKLLAKLFGGRGTLSNAAWSPDGKRLVFVSYQIVPSR
jgi:TolB protein